MLLCECSVVLFGSGWSGNPSSCPIGSRVEQDPQPGPGSGRSGSRVGDPTWDTTKCSVKTGVGG